MSLQGSQAAKQLSPTSGTQPAPVSTLIPGGCRKQRNSLGPCGWEAEVCRTDVTPDS